MSEQQFLGFSTTPQSAAANKRNFNKASIDNDEGIYLKKRNKDYHDSDKSKQSKQNNK